MSIQVQPPQEEVVDFQEEPLTGPSLFSSPEDSICKSSEEESVGPSPPDPSSSPSISSFTSPSGNCSESILKNLSIVSSDPMVVEQIVDNVSVSNDPEVNNGSNGPKVAYNSSSGL